MEISGQLHAPAALHPGTHWMGGSQCRSARCGEEKNVALPGIEPGPVARRYTDWAILTPGN
jgi:hypothetical protein